MFLLVLSLDLLLRGIKNTTGINCLYIIRKMYGLKSVKFPEVTSSLLSKLFMFKINDLC